jgi:hypothetical protein
MSQEDRVKRMREAGIPMPVTQSLMNEGAISAVPVTSRNADKHARLQALKSGAKKQEIQSLVKGKSVQNSFEGIPEPTQKRRPSSQQVSHLDPDKKVPVKNFAGAKPVSGEFAAMEAMYGGNNSAAPINMTSPDSAGASMMNTTQPDLSVQDDGYGPSFDPMGMLAKKRAEMQQSNQYMKHAVAPGQQHSTEEVQQMSESKQQFDLKYMQQMMQEIANKTISEVLNSYTEKNRDKLTYENVIKTKDGSQVIKAQDGKHYKLVPVKLKRN